MTVISGRTITGNSVSDVKTSGCPPATCPQGDGGGIKASGAFSIDHSVISNNTAQRNGGGLFDNVSSANIAVTHTSITGNNLNNASGLGAGVYLAQGPSGGKTKTYSFNRITGNTVAGSSTTSGREFRSTGTIGATKNWWGCNTNPTSTCSNPVLVASGTPTVSPWIVLGLTGNPAALNNISDTSTLTASFLKDSSAGALLANDVDQLSGLGASFQKAISGSLSGA